MSNPQSQQFKRWIQVLIRNADVAEKIETSCCGVTKTRCQTIVEIGRKAKVSLIDLSDSLGVDKSTMSRTVDNLIQQDLVIRNLDNENRRYVVIQLTDKGTDVSKNIEKRTDEYYARLFESIPEEKRGQVLESLELLVDAVKKNCCLKQ